MQTRIRGHITLNDIARSIFRTIINDNHLIEWIVLGQHRLQVLRQIVTLVMRTEDNGDTRDFVHW